MYLYMPSYTDSSRTCREHDDGGSSQRFASIFARREVPQSITCNNAPTFLLGEQILLKTIKSMVESTEVVSALARREIEWIHITPYAPWQGGFYERLIRSIKFLLYKAPGK